MTRQLGEKIYKPAAKLASGIYYPFFWLIRAKYAIEKIYGINFLLGRNLMQNTRLNSLLDALALQWRRWLFNPWRRLSLLIISLLFGFFLGSAVSTTAGQAADWDIIGAAILVALCEIVDRVYYGGDRTRSRSLWVEALNGLKIGLIYSLFLEAFKLGS